MYCDDRWIARSVAHQLRHFFAGNSDMGCLEPWRGKSEDELVDLIAANDQPLMQAYRDWQDELWKEVQKEMNSRI
jgi:hypothetical protein